MSDRLYLLTNAFADEKSGGAKPGRDNIELADTDFIILDLAAGSVWAGLVGTAGPGRDGDVGVLGSERGEAASSVSPGRGGEVGLTGLG